jgi:hypothetical protein
MKIMIRERKRLQKLQEKAKKEQAKRNKTV